MSNFNFMDDQPPIPADLERPSRKDPSTVYVKLNDRDVMALPEGERVKFTPELAGLIHDGLVDDWSVEDD